MSHLANLATIARPAECKVVEVSGRETRGHGPQPFVYGVVTHHTARRPNLGLYR